MSNINNRISIVLVCDDYYAILLGAFLKSIELNHKTEEIIDVYIVDDNISAKSKRKIIESLNSDKMKLNWMLMKDIIPENIQLPLVSNSYPINTYIRVLIPYFIPQHIDKIIFLDVDMIMLEDISKLWNIDIGNKIIGAVSDTIGPIVKTIGAGIENHVELGLDANEKYFNAGLIVINVDKWKAEKITEKTFEAINNNKKYAALGDQYGLNISLIGQWYHVDPLWSCFSVNTIKKPYLVHYFNIKPIFKDYSYNYREEFFYYLNQTAWKGFKPKGKISRKIKKVKNLIQKAKIFLFK
ncbi:glycosyltransferase [Pedobacter sp. Leaf132]|uniref:glycosyltransferase family 8 protein n=1 Tax=Pedobacter sp. Leaf132 TaxID=2876557 RepID=UPI001E5F62CF|nr:glycosyltransferase [Pedobacter sp. Leaf132]